MYSNDIADSDNIMYLKELIKSLCLKAINNSIIDIKKEIKELE